MNIDTLYANYAPAAGRSSDSSRSVAEALVSEFGNLDLQKEISLHSGSKVDIEDLFEKIIRANTDKIHDIISDYAFDEAILYIMNKELERALNESPVNPTKVFQVFLWRLVMLEELGFIDSSGEIIGIDHGRWGYQFPFIPRYEGIGDKPYQKTEVKNILDSILKHASELRKLDDPILDSVLDLLEEELKQGKTTETLAAEIIKACIPPNYESINDEFSLEHKFWVFNTFANILGVIPVNDRLQFLKSIMACETGTEVVDLISKMGLGDELSESTKDFWKKNGGGPDPMVDLPLPPRSDADYMIWGTYLLAPYGQEFDLNSEHFPGALDKVDFWTYTGGNNQAEKNRDQVRSSLLSSIIGWEIELDDDAIRDLNETSDTLKQLYDMLKQYRKTVSDSARASLSNV